MLTLFVLMSQLAAGDDLAPRLAVLETHRERLHAIVVTADAESGKETKLEELGKLLAEGAKTVEEYNELYRKMDEVRTWLLANSAEKPERAEGSFEESGDAWTLRTPLLELTLRKAGLAMSVKTGKETWRMAACDNSDVSVGGGKRFSLTSAGKKSAERHQYDNPEHDHSALKFFLRRVRPVVGSFVRFDL